MEEIDLLRAVYSARLRGRASTLPEIATELGAASAEVDAAVKAAAGKGLVVLQGGGATLTQAGRSALKVVMIGGAFEIIHPGHLHTMDQARMLGNTLVVVVATDKSVLKNKGREPVTSQEWRVRLVSAIRTVDVAVAGGQGSIYDTLEKVKPDVVALGYDQRHNPTEIEEEARRRGIDLKVVRLDSPVPEMKTSKIIGSL